MKRVGFVMLTLSIFASLICALVSGARADDRQEITDLEHKVATVTNANQGMKYYDSGADVVLFDMMGPPYAGQKAIHDHLDEFSGTKDVKVNFLELKVISDGKLAVAWSVQHVTSTGPDGKPFDGTFRQTDIWSKTNGQWKLIHQHVSFPVDMKTGKADMASKM